MRSRCGTGSARMTDRGDRHDRPTPEMLKGNHRLRAEVKELRAAEMLKTKSAYFASEIGPARSWHGFH